VGALRVFEVGWRRCFGARVEFTEGVQGGWSAKRKGCNEFATYHLNRSFPPSNLSPPPSNLPSLSPPPSSLRRRHALGSIRLCWVRHIRIRPNTSMFNATRWGFDLTRLRWVVALVDNVVVGLPAAKSKLQLVNMLRMESFIKR
jgi:hypothetical protein